MSGHFNQLCVLPGITIDNYTAEEFEECFAKKGYKIKFAEEVLTNPDIDDKGKAIPGTGGRTDILFYIDDDNIDTFAIARFGLGIRWWEDVVKYNHQDYLYSKEILDKYPVMW